MRGSCDGRLRGSNIPPAGFPDYPPTPEGRVTEYMLQFNRPDNVRTRHLPISCRRYPR
jgi:hypothetical protein